MPLLSRKISIRYTNAYLKWSFLTCFLMGTSNFITGELSGRLGTIGCYPFFIGNILCWFFYHLYTAYQEHKIYGEYWSKETSIYFHHETGKFNWTKALGPLLRGCVQILIFFSVVFTMQYAYLAQVNQGVISSLFTTSIVFSAIIFYFKYDEVLSMRHVVGICFFIGAVALISIGKHAGTKGGVEDVTAE